MTVDYSSLSLGVEDEAQAEADFLRPSNKSHAETWKGIADGFVATGKRFDRIDPSLVPHDGREKPFSASDVANALKRYADNRNLPMSARTDRSGAVTLARVEREGQPVEVTGPGRPKGRRSRAAEAE